MLSTHNHQISDTSSMYSSVLTRYNSIESSTTTEPTLDKDNFQFPKGTIHHVPPPDSYKIQNPYANSLWYGTRGEVGNETIEGYKRRAAKRRFDDIAVTKIPPRLESLGTKKVDSPIKVENFFEGFDDVHCDSPKYKGLDHAETKYSKVVKELLTTELKYQDDLKLIDNTYRSILHSSKKYKHILSSRQEALIFSNIDTITELSSLFTRDLTKEMSKVCHGYYDFDVEKHFRLVDWSKIDVGDILKNYFVRLSIAYSSYFKNHEAQMLVLQQSQEAGGPKISKWLKECAFLAKSKSDCWDLESLLIKPVQRLPKYLLWIDSMLENSGDDISYVFVEHLYDAKTYMEKLLDSLNTFQASTDPESPTASKYEKSQSAKETTLSNFKESRQEYVDLVNDFKVLYQSLKTLKREIHESQKPFLKFISYQRGFAEKWKTFMEYEDTEVDDYYIKSIYSSYCEKVAEQESKTKLHITLMDKKILKAIDLALENCAAVKYRIKKHNGNRTAYVKYMKGHYQASQAVALEAQDYIVIENQIKDELPPLLEKLGKLVHFLSLSYQNMFQEWLKMMAGSNQVVQYTELLQMGELQIGDNFDIIEMYSTNKHSTRAAMKDICTREDHKQGAGHHEIRIHTSKVVRRLFGL